MSNQLTYTTIQLFNRVKMGKLWAIRDKLDPGQVKILKTLYDSKNKGSVQCQTPITYKLASSTPGKLGYGRLYGSRGSMEMLEQELRGTLCSELYTDVDIVNCHPILIPELSKKLFNNHMPNLEYYNINRESIFQNMAKEYNMSKESIKSLMLSVLYNGSLKNMENPPKLILNIRSEIQQFVRQLITSNIYRELYEYCVRDDKNINGTFLSFIIQTEERKCLESMIHYFTTNGFSVDILAYDGCMTRGINNVSDKHLLDCEQYILTSTGYSVKLKIKPMTELTFEGDDNTPDKLYQNMKQNWEHTHFYFKPTNSVVEITKSGLQHYTWAHAMDAFNDWIINDTDGRKQLFIPLWRKDPERRNIDKLVYKIQKDCLSNEVSLFNGFAYERYEAVEDINNSAIELYKDLLGAICNDEVDVVEYINKTFAHMIQKPFDKTGVCVIFSSKTQGVGKDTLMTLIQNIIGSHTAHYIEDTQFWNKHDTMKEGAILIYLEEANSGANRAKSDALKARITSNDITVEPKGLKSYNVPNIARYFMTTNNPEPVLFEESDRRFLLINPSDRLVGSDWTNIHSKLENHNWIYAIGKYLENVDITDWNPRKFPITEIKKDILELTKCPEKLFLEQWVCNIEGGVLGKDIYREYKNYCIENDLPYAKTSMAFCVKIASYKNKLFTYVDGVHRSKFYLSKK